MRSTCKKRANSARPGRRRFRWLRGLALAVGITTVGITGAAGLRCSRTVTASVVTAHGRIGPQGTSAEHSSGPQKACA
jgi:hypothetical protein